MTFDLNFSWPDFKVELSSLHSWLQSNAPGYIGMSANSACQIHFSSEPSDNVKARVEQYWLSLNTYTEAEKLTAIAHTAKVVAFATQNLPYVDFAQMIVAEKKLWLGQALTPDDTAALAAKYPEI
jgi:hypothetical protein